MTVKEDDSVELNFEVPAPTGRLYANRMIENPYIRYTITEDVQTIVPTLEKQKY